MDTSKDKGRGGVILGQMGFKQSYHANQQYGSLRKFPERGSKQTNKQKYVNKTFLKFPCFKSDF